MAPDQKEHYDIAAALTAMGLLQDGRDFVLTRLAGGVSCDVWRVDGSARGPFVIKRALPKLRVTEEWLAPVERAASEVAWLTRVSAIEPSWVPQILGEDQKHNLFAMEFLPPENHPVWKAELAGGRIEPRFAAQVGDALACIHTATSHNSDLAARFDNGALFQALRIEPYLLFTARKHPDLAQSIETEATRLASARVALVQGDISPKNILCGPKGPVFLDAETATYGDPVFDLAFCLNHLLLKSVWHPRWSDRYQQSFVALKEAYLSSAKFEAPSEIATRTARLLPMLLLARVDGKSPAEYLTETSQQTFVRAAAIQMIVEPPLNLDILSDTYFSAAAER